MARKLLNLVHKMILSKRSKSRIEYNNFIYSSEINNNKPNEKNLQIEKLNISVHGSAIANSLNKPIVACDNLETRNDFVIQPYNNDFNDEIQNSFENDVSFGENSSLTNELVMTDEVIEEKSCLNL